MLLFVLAACNDRIDLTDSAPSPTTPTFSTVPIPPEGEPAIAFAGERPQNVLMISIDTTRRDVFGPYSATGRSYVPFLDSLLTSGFHLDDHQQCSNWTFHSTSCTLGGRYDEDAGFIPQLSVAGRADIPEGQRTLAARLHDAGYYSILLSSNGWLGQEWNNAQGYDEAELPGTGNTTALFAKAMDDLAAAQSAGVADKWLLHVHLVEPHPPYVPPEEYRTEEKGLDPMPAEWNLDTQINHYATVGLWPEMTPEEQELLTSYLTARYHGELTYMDTQLAAVWDDLDAAGLLDDTLVVVWTDHGEQFFERGHQTHAWNQAAEENDAVLFFWAKNLPPREWTRPTHAVDLLPTVLDAIGLPPEPYDPLLSGYVVGTAPDERPRFALSAARAGPLQAVTLYDRKLVFDHDGFVSYYDRATDRYELTDLYTPELAADPTVLELWTLLLPRINKVHGMVPTYPLVIPPELPAK
jgi:arylsulfatase A-like enzyme